jgi:hypothetical protein
MGRPAKDRTCKTRLMRDGSEATIIASRSHKDIDIQFSDGQLPSIRRKSSIFIP